MDLFINIEQDSGLDWLYYSCNMLMYTWKQYKCWLPKNINVEQDSGLDWLKNILKSTFSYRPIPSSGNVVLVVNPSCPCGQFGRPKIWLCGQRVPYNTTYIVNIIYCKAKNINVEQDSGLDWLYY